MALDYGKLEQLDPERDKRALSQGQQYSAQLLGTYRTELPATYQQQTGLLTGALPGLSGAAAGAEAAERAGRLGFLEGGGDQAAGRTAAGIGMKNLRSGIRESAPLMQQLYGDAAAAGPSEISRMLEQQALQELALGDRLSASEERGAQQSARGAWSDRGLAYSNPAMIQEVLQRDRLAREREEQRRMFAGGVNAQLLGEQAQNRQFQTGVEQLGVSRSGSFGDQAAQVAGVRTAIDPRRTVLGTASNVPGLFGTGGNLLSGAGGSQWNALNLGDQYSGLLLNRQSARDIANLNNIAAEKAGKLAADSAANTAEKALWGSVIEGLGNAAGCWVAREVYGEENFRWMLFRQWLETQPNTRRLMNYLWKGPEIAHWLSTRPRWKARVRQWMDRCIATLFIEGNEGNKGLPVSSEILRSIA